MKNVFIVGKENIALKMNDEKKATVIEGVDTVEALLLTVKDSLSKIALNDDNSQEPTVIFLPGYIKGIATGSVTNYIRNKRTGINPNEGTAISDSNLALYREVMVMYGERCLNVSFRDAQYFGKSETEVKLKALNDLAWEIIKKQAKERALNNVTPAKSSAPAVNPKIASKIAELEEQIMDAILCDDEELEASLTLKLNKIKAMAGIKAENPVSNAPEKEEVQTADDGWTIEGEETGEEIAMQA